MENNFTKDTVSKLKILGIYQIIGGIIGLLLTAWLILTLSGISGILIFIFLIIVMLYAYSIYCGILLLKKKTIGLKFSFVNQCLQLVSVSAFGFAFKYVSGVALAIGIDLTESFYFIFDAGVSSWQIIINDDTAPFLLNFNLVALFILFFIDKLKKTIHKEQLENQLASIGAPGEEKFA